MRLSLVHLRNGLNPRVTLFFFTLGVCKETEHLPLLPITC